MNYHHNLYIIIQGLIKCLQSDIECLQRECVIYPEAYEDRRVLGDMLAKIIEAEKLDKYINVDNMWCYYDICKKVSNHVTKYKGELVLLDWYSVQLLNSYFTRLEQFEKLTKRFEEVYKKERIIELESMLSEHDVIHADSVRPKPWE